MSNITVIEQNKCVGKLKELYLIIHVDKEGNEGIFAFLPKPGPELSPYVKDLPLLEKRVDELNKEIGPEIGIVFKVKKFFALHLV